MTHRRESDLYPLIGDVLRRHGYPVVVEQVSFRHPVVKTEDGRDYWPQVDVAAFRWHDNDVDAIAVEAKRGASPSAPLWAVEQAASYQLLFPRVFIATEADASAVQAFSEPIMRQLGLGYIHVAASRATMEMQSQLHARTSQRIMDDVLRPAAVTALLWHSLIREEARLAPCLGEYWVWSRSNDQMQLQLGTDHDATYAACYSETKPVCSAIAAAADPVQVATLLATIPSRFARHHRVRVGVKNPAGSFVPSAGTGPHHFGETPGEITRALSVARNAAAAARTLGTLEFRVALWPNAVRPDRIAAEGGLEAALPGLTALRDYLNALLP